jgi:hypothetical protein
MQADTVHAGTTQKQQLKYIQHGMWAARKLQQGGTSEETGAQQGGDDDGGARGMKDSPLEPDPVPAPVVGRNASEDVIVTLNMPLLGVVESIHGNMGAASARLLDLVVAVLSS